MDVGLVFGIIFAAIVIGLLVFFGFRYINDMISVTCESQMQQQMEDFKNAVKSTFALSEGSVQEFRIIAQSSCAARVCFIDPKNPGIENSEGGWIPNEFLEKMISRYEYNLLFIRPNGAVEGYAIERARPYVNFCVTSTREVMLRNIGTTVEITLPEFE